MAASNLVLVQGLRDTRGTLARWNVRPWPVLRGWLALAGAIAAGLLAAVWAIASVSAPDPTPVALPGLTHGATMSDAADIFGRNLLVLALHAMACVAGFIAGSSMPAEAERRTGLMRAIHEKAGPAAIVFVVAATAFSLGTQAYVLGSGAATLAAQGGTTPGILLLGLLPHAIPELIALFLPLAAWMTASRRGEWHELLAATLVTTALALPTLGIAALTEVFVSPHLVRALTG